MTSFYKKPNLNNLYFDDYIKNVPSLDNKVIAITGTTSGTGYVAADVVAKKGATVILLNRNSQRSVESFSNLKNKNPKSSLISIDCDLQSFESVKNAVKNIEEVCVDGLDVLCNNAGVMALKDKSTNDGFDIQMQTNHLSHFLLTKKLFPLLKKAESLRGEARIINHTSMTRYAVKKLESKYFEKRGGKLGGNGSKIMNKILLGMILSNPRWYRYSQTKLANAAFTACLDEKIKAQKLNIKALLAHPGLAITNLQSTTVNDGGMGSFMTSKLMNSGQTMEDGSIGIITCMTKANVNSGEFYGPGAGKMAMKGPVIKFSLENFYNNVETKNLLWTKSCEAIGEEFNI